MKFIVIKSSSWEYKEEKEINSLEELIEFSREVKGSLILETKEEEPHELEIYDDYRE